MLSKQVLPARAPQPPPAALGRHSRLCSAQCATWHSRLQQGRSGREKMSACQDKLEACAGAVHTSPPHPCPPHHPPPYLQYPASRHRLHLRRPCACLPQPAQRVSPS